MTLLYAYIKDYKVLKDEEINFDSTWRFAYKADEGILVGAKGIKPLPQHFFSTENSNSYIESVTAIVGRNGSGKTTLAAFLSNIKTLNVDKKRDFILVWKAKKRIHCAYHLPSLGGRRLRIKPSGTVHHKWDIKRKCFAKGEALEKLGFLYYSPAYTPHSPCDRDLDVNVLDLSTTWMLKSTITECVKQNIRREVPYRAYELAEFSRMLHFAVAHRKCEKTCITFPLTQYIEVCCDTDACKKIRNNIDKGKISVHDSFKSALVGALSISGHQNFYVRAFICMIAAYVYDHRESMLHEERCEWVREFFNVEKRIKSIKARRDARLTYEEFSQSSIDMFFAKFSSRFSRQREVFAMLKKLLLTIQDSAARNSTCITKELTSKKEELDLIAQLNRSHAAAVGGSEFLKFRLGPEHSAGELNFYSLCGRLYQVLSTDANHEAKALARCSDVVVYIDEAENYFHPEWQRCFVYNLIWFFETFVPKRNFHIILSTHSPIILSDIPISNCHFLQRREDGTARICATDDKRNTFAANIYDLYRDSFFLDKGPIGEFAKQKLNAVLVKIRERDGEPLSESDASIVDLIGDEPVYRFLSEKMNMRRE